MKKNATPSTRPPLFLTLCSVGLAAFGAHAQMATTAAPQGPASALRAGLAGTLPDRPASGIVGDVAPKADDRWRSSLDAFDAADRLHAPAPDGVLFVGSSSIRLWEHLEDDFQALPVVLKRGFGGSRMMDCAAYLDQLVVRYRPRQVIVYAGDNDLAEGRTPQQVLESFRAFVEGVRRALPETRIAYLSIKPSPLRQALMPAVRETNSLIEQYSHTQANLDYIDIYSKMLGPDGKPRGDLFREDRLHMNAAGYALWKDAIAAHLR